MRLGGLDIATASGLALMDGETITATSFRPRAKRPFELRNGEVDFNHEGRIAAEFRDHLRAWLVDNRIEAVAIERPMQSNVTFKKPTVDMNAGFYGQAIRYETKGGTNFSTIFRLYVLAGEACELCARLNIPVHIVTSGEWRKAFLGDLRPPKGHENPSAWWKHQAKLQCERIKVSVPNADAADGVGIVWWLRGKLNPRLAARHDDLFRVTK